MVGLAAADPAECSYSQVRVSLESKTRRMPRHSANLKRMMFLPKHAFLRKRKGLPSSRHQKDWCFPEENEISTACAQGLFPAFRSGGDASEHCIEGSKPLQYGSKRGQSLEANPYLVATILTLANLVLRRQRHVFGMTDFLEAP